MINWLYDAASGTIKIAMMTVWRARATGVENVPPKTGPLIICCNHVSYLIRRDGLLRRAPDQLYGEKELFDIPPPAAICRASGLSGRPERQRPLGYQEVARGSEDGAPSDLPRGDRNLTGEIEAAGGRRAARPLSKAPVVPACIVGSDRANCFLRLKSHSALPYGCRRTGKQPTTICRSLQPRS